MSQNTRGLIATISGFAALGFAILSLFYWVAVLSPPMSFDNIDTTLKVLAIAAILLFAVYLLVSPDSVGQTMGKRSSRLTANALVAALVGIAIGVVINIIVDNVPAVRADWTAGKDFSISPQTVKVLKDLDSSDKVVTAVGFFYRVNSQSTLDLFGEYAAHTARFRFEIVNPSTQPQRARDFGVTEDGTVVFTDGSKRETARPTSGSPPGEAEFTSALVRLSQGETKRVAFLTGHGERSINDAAEQGGYGAISESLKQDSYETVQWSLTTSPTIPVDDVDVLVIADPRTAFNGTDIAAVQRYLEAGGHVLLAADVNTDPEQIARRAEVIASLNRIIAPYGVSVRDGLVVDANKRLSFAPQDPTVFGIDSYSGSEITQELARANLATVFYGAVAVVPPTTTLTTTTSTTLLQTSPDSASSWLEVAPNNGKYDPGTSEIGGPVSIGVAIDTVDDPAASGTLTDTQAIRTRLVVLGDADFASNLFINVSSQVYISPNRDLFSNAVSWLAGVNELISIRKKDPTAPRTLTLDAGQKNLQLITAVFGLPLFVLLLGGAVWWRRK